MFGKESGEKSKTSSSEFKKRMIKSGLIVGGAVILIGGKVVWTDMHKTSTPLPTGHVSEQVQTLKHAALPVPRAVPIQNAGQGLLPSPPVPAPSPQPMRSTAVTAAPATPAADAQEITALISTASQGAATVQNVYMNGPNGFVGVVYQIAGGDRGLAWVNLPDHLVLIGTLLNAHGQDLNGPYLLAKNAKGVSTAVTPAMTGGDPVAQTGGSSMDTAYSSGDGFMEGTTGPEATVYIDPDSAKGHDLYLALAPLIHAGKIKIRYVPIAEKGKHSLAVAEAILSAPNPEAALSKNEHLFKKKADGQNTGGLRGIAPNLQMTQIVDGNTGMLAAAGYIDDPVMVYCNRAGQYQVQEGHQATLDLNAVLQNIGACH